MFSHLKLHGGSNHFFLPTGLLQQSLADASPADRSLGALADFAGGVVRIEASTSSFLNGLYPGEVRQIHPEPTVRHHARQAGHVARLFTHPGARTRNLRGKSLAVGGGLTRLGLGLVFEQAPNGVNGSRFIQYTLPALEVRMMLEAIRSIGEGFVLEYTRIRSAPPLEHTAAEAWRATGCGTRVTLRQPSGQLLHTPSGQPSGQPAEEAHGRSCTAVDTCAPGSDAQLPRACASDELAVLDVPPGWLARTFVLSNPYPILELAGRMCGSSG